MEVRPRDAPINNFSTFEILKAFIGRFGLLLFHKDNSMNTQRTKQFVLQTDLSKNLKMIGIFS